MIFFLPRVFTFSWFCRSSFLLFSLSGIVYFLILNPIRIFGDIFLKFLSRFLVLFHIRHISWYRPYTLGKWFFLLISFFLSFFTRVTSWFLTGVWVRVSLLKSPGFFSVFCLIAIILKFLWSPLVLLFPSPSVLVWLYQENQLHLYHRHSHVVQFFYSSSSSSSSSSYYYYYYYYYYY